MSSPRSDKECKDMIHGGGKGRVVLWDVTEVNRPFPSCFEAHYELARGYAVPGCLLAY